MGYFLGQHNPSNYFALTMFRFPSVICTRCTGFFCLAIIKGPPNDIYCIIEEPYKHYFTEKVSYSHYLRFDTLILSQVDALFSFV